MQNIRRNVMNAIKMKRVELLNIVKTNLAKHVAEYVNSVEDYKFLVKQIATDNLKWAKTGNLKDFKNIKSNPTLVQSYETEYKRAICMLELSIDDIIEVEEDVFNQLVLDEWHWSSSFKTLSSTYKIGG